MEITPFVMLAAGLLFVVVPVRWELRAWKRRRTWTRADATVTSAKDKKTPDGRARIVVKYRFTDATGQGYGGVDNPLFRKPSRKSRIPIRYRPDDPNFNETATTSDVYAEVALIGGLSILGAGVLVWGIISLTG